MLNYCTYVVKKTDNKQPSTKRMNKEQLEPLRFPEGRFIAPESYTQEVLSEATETIANFPSNIRALVKGLSNQELAWIYRPEGWNIRQVVHHCADSHMNAFIRFKLALTETNPTIKSYEQGLWAELGESDDFPLEPSLQIIDGLHARFAALLKSMDGSDYKKTFHHPERDKTLSLEMNACLYAWHCKHHLGHIKNAIENKGSF